MSSTLTLNGTVAKTDSSYARSVFATLGTATPECPTNFFQRLTVRQRSLDGTFPTTLPFEVALPVVAYSCLIIRVQGGSATLKIKVSGQEQTLVIGSSSQPEGVYFLFGQLWLERILVLAVDADNTNITVVAAGTQANIVPVYGFIHAISNLTSALTAV